MNQVAKKEKPKQKGQGMMEFLLIMSIDMRRICFGKLEITYSKNFAIF